MNNDIFKIESMTIIGDKVISNRVEEKELKWQKLEEDSIYQAMLKNMGIGSINSFYIEVNEIQDWEDEYKKILRFLRLYVKQYCLKNKLQENDVKLEFINYGKTELVYVLTEREDKRVTLLVK